MRFQPASRTGGWSGNIGKRLVDGDALDQRRVIVEDSERRVSQPLILPEVAMHENQPGAKFPGPTPRHAAMHAKGLGFIGRGEDHPTTDGNRFALQGGVEQLFDRGIEGIEIGVKDCRPG